MIQYDKESNIALKCWRIISIWSIVRNRKQIQ